MPATMVFAALAAMWSTAAAATAIDRVAAALSRGACTQAATEAERAQASAHDDAALAAVLALRTRVALDCLRPQAPGLDDWLARERELRTRADGAGSPAVAEVELQRLRREQQLDHLDDAFAGAKALDRRAATSGWPPALRARIAVRIASISNQRADPTTALEAADRAGRLAAEAGDEATRVAALEDRGFALARMRRGDAASTLAEAVPLAAKHFGANSREYAEALRLHGQGARMIGDFGTAIERFEQSLAILRAQPEPDRRAIANTLLNLGQARKLSGDGNGAAAAYEAALAAEAKDPDLQRPTRAATLHALANLERDRGHPQRAVELYAQAEPAFERKFGADSVLLAQVYNNHGNAEANLGRYDAANALYQRAVDIARKRGSVDPGDYLPLANLAMVQTWQGRYAEAEKGFREALAHQKTSSVGSETSTLFAYMGLAASLWGQRRFDDAMEAAVAAEQVREAALRLAASHLGEKQSVDLQEYLRPSLDLVVAIAAASGSSAHLERAWQSSMSARDAVTSIQVQRLAAARKAGDARTTTLWHDWREASAAAARAELGHGDAAEARAELERAERALAMATPLAASLGARAPTFADVRHALPGGESLVLFTQTRLRGASDFAKDAVEQRSPDLYAFLLPTRDGDVRARKLGTLERIAAAVDAWDAALADRDVALATVIERGRAVRKAIWQPLHDAGAGDHWLVLPTAALYRAPWGALPDDDRWLTERGFRAHVLNHERELLAEAAPTAPPRLLAIVDPMLASTALPEAARRCASGLSALPGARSEGVELDAMWRAHFGSAARSTLLVGGDATEARMRSAIATADIAHFGTHGVGLAGDCAAATDALALRGASLSFDAPLEADTPALAPVALLLAPGVASDSDDDGLLSAEEIAALDLSHMRWAVLAACSTASGATRRYEGPFGLARAFRLAGARTVLTSLWSVDDAATAEWSRTLYLARIERGLGTADALADAQRSLIAARRARGDSTHPYYWAAFTATGDWR
jgi:CHAT domain-containing protein/tetratricopeptide (TPR) repeat protein